MLSERYVTLLTSNPIRKTDKCRCTCIINRTREGVSIRYAKTGKVRGRNTNIFSLFFLFFCNLLFSVCRLLVHVYICYIKKLRSFLGNFFDQ